MKSRFKIIGMNCAACSSHVEQAVLSLPGIISANVNLMAGTMIAEFDEKTLNDSMIIDAVRKAGYGASLLNGTNTDKYDDFSKLLSRLIVSTALLLILIYSGMGQMIGLPVPSFINRSLCPQGYSVAQLVLSLTVIIFNFSYYSSGFAKLIRLKPNMDSLVSMGSCISFVYSTVLTVKIVLARFIALSESAFELSGRLYFESAAMILVFVSIGKTLEAKSKEKTRSSINSLINLKPLSAVKLTDEGEIIISADEISPGDILLVRSGESIPADGVIVEGYASLDESLLTGESVPIDKIVGDSAYQATINRSGFIKIRVTRDDRESALSKIIELVEEAASTKAPVSRLADKISAIFVPIVFGISIVTFVIWMLSGQPLYVALRYAVTVIVISCPCSLGLATPTAITVGTGRAAKYGILIKSAAVLEELHKIDTVVFDKTGTITEGKLKCTEIIPDDSIELKEFLQLAYAAENLSEHPIAKAITEYIRTNFPYGRYEASSYENIPGGGIRTAVNDDIIICGNEALVSKYTACPSSRAVKYAQEGKTPILFAKNNNYIGMIVVSDQIRSTSIDSVRKLKGMNITTELLSGDNYFTSERIAGEAEIEQFRAGLKPNEKEQCIRELIDSGRHVAMVGDGVNDAPALTAASIGIAIGAGTDIAIDSADIILTGSEPIDIVNSLTLGRRVYRIIKQNLFWAFFYNCLGIPIAAGVLEKYGISLNPMIAAALMSCSSLFVVSNALRINFIKLIAMENKTKDNTIEQNETVPDQCKEKEFMKVNVIVEGMMCIHCKAHVEEAFNSVDGIECCVDLESKTAALTLERNFSDEELFDIVKKAGYEPKKVIRL